MNQTSSPTTSLSTSSGISADAISRRAYELWEQEGKPDGCDLRHWLQAEEELSGVRQLSTEKPRVSGNGTPRHGATAAAAHTGTDVQPLQGTRAGAAAARDTRRGGSAPPMAAKPGTAAPGTTGRRR